MVAGESCSWRATTTAPRAEIGALAENLGFSPINLGGLLEGGLLVQARENSRGRLISKDMLKFDYEHDRRGRRALVGCPTVLEMHGMYDQSKLSELIRFAKVDSGSTVIDVYPGDGDWTRLFSDIVGPAGRVYSFVPAEVAHFKNDPIGRIRTLAQEPGRENVEAVSADLVAMPEATQPADVVWLHLFYHDLHTALIQARGATAAHFNRAVYERLKRGGSYVIVDHAAAAGAGTNDAQSLHRIAPASVREEVEAAGFVLDSETTLLANKGDAHSVKAFDPSIKGRTDRFAYRFVKP